jgi:CRP-like cAMP-binding protein
MNTLENTVFQHLNATQIANFTGACQDRHYKAGDELIHRGGTGDKVFFLRQGTVRVFLPAVENGELAVLEAPAVVGEMELLTGKPRSASVVAVTDVHALAMPFETMQKRMRDGDAATLKILANFSVVLAQRLSATLDQLMRLEKGEAVRSDELQDFRKKLFADWSF